jgi:photosystem II stability/assembly factor-like uncharacterized protein
MPRPVFRALLLTLLLLAPATGFADKDKKEEPKTEPTGLADLAGIEGLKYRSIGPAWGGRVARAAGVPGDPLTYYAATASGGVWKSSDGAFTWKPIFDDQPISSIGSIAVAASDPNVIYVGSGEANIRGNVAAGNGIYKSTDAGKTWTHVWKQEGQIGTMTVHPRNPDVAFAAVLGHAFGPNPERGVYRTKNGGRTWEQVLKKDENTGASDVAIDPSNPNVVFAGLWQARRRPWELTSGGPGSGLWVSRDGGDTWTQITKGLPEGTWGKVGVTVAPSDGRRVYALIEAEKGGLFRSDDGGESWTLATRSRELRQRAWYYSTLTVSPANPNEVWAPNVPMLKSIDGGKTFKQIFLSHGDHHDLWIDPKDPRRMIGADDGGMDVSMDGGETWKPVALPIGQFYHIAVDERAPFQVAGALQDIGTAQGPSNSLSRRGINNADWHGVGGGEAGWVASDPEDPDVVYAGEYLGIITRYDQRTGEERNVSAWPDNPSGWAAKDMAYRFQWTAPIHISPHDPKTVYHGANVLFRSKDGGQSWEAISPDLTRDDESKQQWSGGPITGDNTGVETYCTIFVIAESPKWKGLIWVGSDDGLVHLTRDGGSKWEDVTKNIPGIPEWGTVSMIEPSRYDSGTAYLVVDAHRLDDMQPYLWKTADYGKTWKRLDKNLPRDVYLHSVREDPVRKGVLYLATERGVAVSKDDGATWSGLRLNLPTVAVHDLAVKGNSLVLGTHGRSAWILDDLSVVREISEAATAKAEHLFSAPDAVRWTWHGGSRYVGPRFDNPEPGAAIYYWLKDDAKGDVTIEIFDSAGTLVRKMSSSEMEPTGSSEYIEDERELMKKRALPKKKGLQRVMWDMAWEGSELVQGGILDSGYPLIGPEAIPGTYNVRLTVDGTPAVTEATTLRILPDPRSTVPQEALAEQLRFTLDVRDAITHLTRTAEQVRSVRRQVVARNELLKKDPKAADLIKASEAFLKKLDAVEERLHNPKAEIAYDVLAMKGGAMAYSRLSPLFEFAKNGDGPPTQGMKNVYAAVKKDLDAADAEWKALVNTDLAALQKQAEALDLPKIYVP